MLFLTVALPFALASLLASGRYGAEHRQAAMDRLLASADSIVRQATSAGMPPAPATLLAGASRRGLPAAVYRREADGHFVRVQALPDRFGEAELAARDARALLARSRAVAATPSAGSLAGLAPLMDPVGQRLGGALLVVAPATAPPLLPALPAAGGLLALVLLLVAAAGYAERPGLLRAALVFLPPVAFIAWLILALPIAPGGGGYRYWAVSSLGCWTVLAAIGLRLATRHHPAPGR